MIKQDRVEEDKNIPSDIRTANIVKELANQIYEFIQVEIDCPSLHNDNCMPILDLEVRMKNNNIVYNFYRKEMVNFNVLMANSAMPLKMRRVSLVQEVVRILRNTSKRVEEKEKLYHLSEFSMRLKVSGYDAQFRLNIIKAGMTTYQKQVAREEEGVRPLYRPKGYEEEERRKKKNRAKVTWYKPSDTVLFVPPTPNGELQRRLKQVVEDVGKHNEIKVKIVERAGIKIRSMLPGLKDKVECGRSNCMIHSTGGHGNCNIEGVVYKGKCLDCEKDGKKSVYIGETGRSAYTRGVQHMNAIGNPEGHTSNAFARHIIEKHDGEETDFKIDVVRSYKKPLERQVREGVEIFRTEADNILNSKLDHFQPVMKRITFSDILDELEML